MKSKNVRNPNGSGSVYYDEKRTKWVGEVQWTDKQGIRRRKKFSGQKKTIVKNKLDDFKRQIILSSDELIASDITFQEFADNWLRNILVNKLKPTSFTRKEITLTQQVYPYLGNIPITQITHNDIQDMINSLHQKGFSYSTIKKAYEAVNGCFKEFRIKTSSYVNPCEGISMPTNIKNEVSNITFFNSEQRNLIIKEAKRKYKTGKSVYRLGHSIILLMFTGLRISELLALTWNDIDFENNSISINKSAVISKEVDKKGISHYSLINQNNTKTRSGNRIVPLNKVALDSIREIQLINGNNQYVMSTASGRQVTPRNINRLFHSILKQTGIADEVNSYCGVHTLRHTFASMLFQNGCDVKIVSEILGHSNTKITENIYIHVIQEQKIKAINDIDKYIN